MAGSRMEEAVGRSTRENDGRRAVDAREGVDEQAFDLLGGEERSGGAGRQGHAPWLQRRSAPVLNGRVLVLRV
jgi:hypothetical protein